MYLSFFGLNEKPFSITPDPRYLFLSERHAEALAHLVYGIGEAGGFIQLTGEVGTGKTTVIRSLLAQTPKNTDVALILNPRISAPEFLLTLCEELGIGVPDSAEGSVKELVDILNRYLLRAHAEGRRIVLIVDEAQNLAPEVLEQVRLLTNLETETQKLLQIILIGQPELRELLGRVQLRQLAQRITGRFHLDPLSRSESVAYVRHRLRVAGATQDVFTPAALRALHQVSGGVPRLINVIADRALLGAYTQDRHHIGAALIHSAANEVFGRRTGPTWLPWAGAAGALLAVIALAFGVQAWRSNNKSSAASAAVAAQADNDSSAAPPSTNVPALPGTTPVSAASSAATRNSATTGRIAPQTLTRLLAAYAAESDTDNAFNKLFALWKLQYVVGNTDGCAQASKAGLDCLVQRGSIQQLRQIDRPAILDLLDAEGRSYRVVLAGLIADRAALSIGGARREVALDELTHFWTGDYVLLWRAGSSDGKTLSMGMHGPDVARLRANLLKIRGVTRVERVSSLFDHELARAVAEFQRSHQLGVDGIAGVQTLVAVDTALAGSDTPLLSANNIRGT